MKNLFTTFLFFLFIINANAQIDIIHPPNWWVGFENQNLQLLAKGNNISEFEVEIDYPEFGTLSLIFSYIILFNVILSYGLETSFFRFYNTEKNKNDVLNTAAISIIITSFIFASLFSIFKLNISDFTGISTRYLSIVLWILVVDALTVIPFAYLRLKGDAFKYSVIKIINVIIYFSLNIITPTKFKINRS